MTNIPAGTPDLAAARAESQAVRDRVIRDELDACRDEMRRMIKEVATLRARPRIGYAVVVPQHPLSHEIYGPYESEELAHQMALADVGFGPLTSYIVCELTAVTPDD